MRHAAAGHSRLDKQLKRVLGREFDAFLILWRTEKGPAKGTPLGILFRRVDDGAGEAAEPSRGWGPGTPTEICVDIVWTPLI